MRKIITTTSIAILFLFSQSLFARCVAPVNPPSSAMAVLGTVDGFYINTTANNSYSYVILKDLNWEGAGTGVSIGGDTRTCGYFAFLSSDKHILAMLMDAKNNTSRMKIRSSSTLSDGTWLIAYIVGPE